MRDGSIADGRERLITPRDRSRESRFEHLVQEILASRRLHPLKHVARTRFQVANFVQFATRARQIEGRALQFSTYRVQFAAYFRLLSAFWLDSRPVESVSRPVRDSSRIFTVFSRLSELDSRLADSESRLICLDSRPGRIDGSRVAGQKTRNKWRRSRVASVSRLNSLDSRLNAVNSRPVSNPGKAVRRISRPGCASAHPPRVGCRRAVCRG